jgi:uncharacterized membrane protein
MANFLSNLRYVVWTGLALGVVFFLIYALKFANAPIDSQLFWQAGFRWLHVMSGIMWIGLLWYFNFVQTPNAPKIPEEHRGPAIGKVITPAALFWFRWGAMATIVTGIALASINGYLAQAYTLGAIEGFAAPKDIVIGIGMWLATIMWFNVWFIIWPNQQKALNIDNKYPDLAADLKAAAARTAGQFSRVNTLLSIPMLVAMTGVQTLG